MVYIFLADGFEIIEAMSPIDMLTRAGIDVTLVGVGKKSIRSSCGVSVNCDVAVDELPGTGDAEAVILPGGMPGTVNLFESEKTMRFVDEMNSKGGLVCAICAAPSILGKKGLLSGREATCFPGFEEELAGAKLSESFVCRDGNIITARGAGVSIEFGLEIVAALKGKELADRIRASIQYSEELHGR